MKFSNKDFFSKCDQIRRKLRIWSHLLKKSLMEICAVDVKYLARNNSYVRISSKDFTFLFRFGT